MMIKHSIIMTGSTGYVGSNLLKSFTKEDFSIHLMGRESSLMNVSDNFTKIYGDLSLPLKDNSIDNILDQSIFIHCAASISKDVDDSWKNNVIATKNLLDIAVKKKAKLFIFISTGGVYGENNVACDELTLPNPPNPYNYSKLLAEETVKMYAKNFDMNCLIFRLYFPYAGQNIKGIFNTIPTSIINGSEFIINKNGAPLISSIHVDDISTIITTFIKKPFLPTKFLKIYNLCGDEIISFYDLVNLFAERLSLKPNLKFSDNYVGNILGKNELLKVDLKWSPTKNIRNYIFDEFEFSS